MGDLAKSSHSLVELDGVGGAVILIRAALHREGVVRHSLFEETAAMLVALATIAVRERGQTAWLNCICCLHSALSDVCFFTCNRNGGIG
eukprot:SAG31_NODE_1139_length_9713_cov_28.936863_4_plen_89_part_00